MFFRLRFYIAFFLFYIISNYGWIYMWQDNQWMKTLGLDIFTALGAAIATACLYHVYKKASEAERFFWFFVYLSCLSSTIAEVSWGYYELVLKVEVPFPGLPDVFYLLQLVFILLAILYLIYKKDNIFISIRLFLDILITMTVAAALSWHFLIQPIFTQEDVTLLFKAVAVAYPIADLGLLFGILSLNATSRTFSRKVQYALVIGLSLFGVADCVYLYLNAKGSYHTGSIIDPLWTLALFFIVIAGLYSEEQNGKTQTEGIKLDRDPIYVASLERIAIPYISLFVLLTVISVRISRIDSIVLGSIFGIVLISIRQILNLLDNKHLLFLLSQSNQKLEISKKALEERHESLRQTSATMKMEARTDFLTGLYNRRYIEESLGKLLEKTKSHKLYFSLFMLDIDHFKHINDRFGHEAGDAVLQQITQIMLKNTRCEEIIGRFGGEEFIGFLPEVGIAEAEMIAERLRNQIAEHIFVIGCQTMRVTVSIGVSQWSSHDDDDAQSLLKRIDKALYKAKDKGRNCTVLL